MGMVIFKSGGMMFKLKNKFFSFPETLFIFKFFFFFGGGGGRIGRCPKVMSVSWITMATPSR